MNFKKLKASLLALVLILTAFSTVSCAKSPTTLSSTKSQITASTGFLWKVQKNGNTVYLLGSIHVANEAMYPLRPAIEAAFKSADYLGVEVDMTKIDQAPDAIQKQIFDTGGTYKDGTYLQDHVTADTYQKVVDILKARRIPRNSFDAYKPGVVSTIISNWQILDKGYKPQLGIDNHFMQKAISENKPILQLETFEQQGRMLGGFSASLQEDLLNQAIADYNNPNEDLEESINYQTKMWSDGDEDALLSLVKKATKNAEFYKAMLADRNAGMLTKIVGYLTGDQKKTYFIIVGGAHMLGDDGIVTMLEKDGFTVEKP